MDFFLNILRESWNLLVESSVYVVFGLLISGLLRVFLSPNSVAKHLNSGPIWSVIKVALLGIPVPL